MKIITDKKKNSKIDENLREFVVDDLSKLKSKLLSDSEIKNNSVMKNIIIKSFDSQVEKLNVEKLKVLDNQIEINHQRFREVQKIFKDLENFKNKFPNVEHCKILSNMDLSNIEDVIDLLKSINYQVFIDETNDETIDVLKRYDPKKYAIIPLSLEWKIKQTVLRLGIKYPRLHITEIAEKIEEPEDCIIVVARRMIKNKEINAEYFKSTRSLVFNQQANIDEIDDLMKKFEDWEKKA